MKISIVGLGLIGGSMARDLKSQLNVRVFGVEADEVHAQKAMDLQLVEEVIPMEKAMEVSDIIILATPVHTIENILPAVLEQTRPSQVIIDTGSTKVAICNAVSNHAQRGHYVAAHPLAGTEFSGPEAALSGLFNRKKNIICEKEKSNEQALAIAIKLFASLGMETFFLSAEEHDKHLAYVSHLSHVSSFMLGLTVLHIEKDEKQIFNLASTGFESTVRLAKSNPLTWTPIFDKNKKFVSEALERYIALLQTFKKDLDEGNTHALKNAMQEANAIKKIIV